MHHAPRLWTLLFGFGMGGGDGIRSRNATLHNFHPQSVIVRGRSQRQRRRRRPRKFSEFHLRGLLIYKAAEFGANLDD